MKGHYNVLFLCTGNSARSIMAEVLANHLGHGRFTAYSAGSSPRGQVNAMALQVLQEAGFPTEGLRSKPWDEFAQPGTPEMDLVITVCDRAAGESCPVWPGQPVTAHWGVPDPAEADGSADEIHKAFVQVMLVLQQRISLLMALKIEALDRLVLESKVREIGRS
jgi:arsenate reductase